jgi:hypothetical protein
MCRLRGETQFGRQQDKKIERIAPILKTDEDTPLSKFADDPGS